MTLLSKPRKPGFSRSLRRSFVSVFVASVSALAAPSQPTPTAGQILDRYIKVTGGFSAWHEQKSERTEIEGRALDDNRVVLRATISTTRSGNTLSQVQVPQEAAEGVYKGVAWALSPFSGVRIKRGAERDEAIRDAHMLEEVDWPSLYPRARLGGIEEIDGRHCYKILMNPDTAEWFDAATGFLVRRESNELSASGAIPVGYTIEQYATHAGLTRPVRMLAWRDDFQYQLTVLNVAYNQTDALRYPAPVAEYLALDRAGKALPNAEEIIERHIYETGGVEAYGNLKTQRITGALTFLSTNTEARVETWAAGGGKYYESIDVPGLGKQEEGSDGLVSWERSPVLGPRVKPKNAMPGLGMTLDAAQVIAWRLLTDSVRTEAAERIDGHDCWRVRIIPRHGGQLITRWYDRQTGLLYRTSVSLATDMGALPVVMTFEEYRDAAGLKWPARIRMTTSTQQLLFKIDDVRLNEAIEPTVFELPAEIKEIAQKNQSHSAEAAFDRSIESAQLPQGVP